MPTQIREPGGRAPDRDEQIEQLRHELAGLRRENRRLTKLADPRLKDPSGNRPEETLEYQTATRRLINSGSYAAYLSGFIRASSPYRVWNRVVSYLRRFRFLSAAIRISTRIVAIIETSAALLIIASAAIILVPLLLVISGITLIAGFLQSRKALRELSGIVRGRDVYVFFPVKKEQLRQSSFYAGTLSELSRDPGNTNIVIAVSPALLTDAGSMFLTARKKKEQNFYIVRRHFFFRLHEILKSAPANLTYVY